MYLKKLTSQFCVENKVLYFPFYVQFIISFILASSFYCISVTYLLNSEEGTIEDIVFTFIFVLVILFSRSLQQLVVYLDRSRPWLIHLPKRLFIQLILGVVVPSLPAAACLAFFFSIIIDEWSISLAYILVLYPSIFMLGFVINLLYLIWFFSHLSFFIAKLYSETQDKLAELRDQERQRQSKPASAILNSLEVRFGFRREVIAVKNIGIFEASAEGRTCMLKQMDKRYEFDYSLDVLATRLDARKFFKVNRRYILNRSVIAGYKDTANGRLIILLNQACQGAKEIMVSRSFAKEFKNWYDSSG